MTQFVQTSHLSTLDYLIGLINALDAITTKSDFTEQQNQTELPHHHAERIEKLQANIHSLKSADMVAIKKLMRANLNQELDEVFEISDRLQPRIEVLEKEEARISVLLRTPTFAPSSNYQMSQKMVDILHDRQRIVQHQLHSLRSKLNAPRVINVSTPLQWRDSRLRDYTEKMQSLVVARNSSDRERQQHEAVLAEAEQTARLYDSQRVVQPMTVVDTA
ncbi:MAG: hypothetical protein ABIR91_02560 [Candidatus Saccharimonadales bacterium]